MLYQCVIASFCHRDIFYHFTAQAVTSLMLDVNAGTPWLPPQVGPTHKFSRRIGDRMGPF